MMLSKKKQYVLAGVLVILVGGVFLFVPPAQDGGEVVSLEQSSLPNRAPEGYAVPARDVVTLPFTHVSADRLRLGNVREVAEGKPLPVLVSGSYPGIVQSRRSPDGQWTLQPPLSIIKTDGSGEERALFADSEYLEYEFDANDRKYVYDFDHIAWSWDSSHLFYPVQRLYKEGSESFGEGWVESVDISTGKITRHPDIGFYSNLHSYATARYPTDPVIFEDSTIYDRSGPRGIKTHDGSASWVIDDFFPLYLSPDKQMVLGYDRHNTERALIYTVDGSTLLYGFDSEVPVYWHLWSPDGSKFVYRRAELDQNYKIITTDLFIMNLDGTGKTQLTNTPEIHEFPQGWTLDGQLVVFYAEDRWYIADLITE